MPFDFECRETLMQVYGISRHHKLIRVGPALLTETIKNGHDSIAYLQKGDGERYEQPYRRIDLAKIFSGINAVYEVREGCKPQDVLDAINAQLGVKFTTKDIVTFVVPKMVVGRTHVITFVAKATSPAYRGCVSIRINNSGNPV